MVAVAFSARGRVATATVLAAPLILFLLLPNAVSLVTLSIVSTLGTAAIAGMGVAVVIFGMLLALLFGLDTGTQAFVSRATGSGEHAAARQALSSAASLGAVLGLTLAALTAIIGPKMAALLLHDAAAQQAATDQLHALASSLFFLGISIPFNAYWIGTGATRIPFFVALAAAPVQIALTWVLVPSLHVLGAGLASVTATLLSLILQFVIAKARGVILLRPTFAGALGIARIGWPVSLQQSTAQTALVVAYAIVSQLGVQSVAILNVLASLTMLPIQFSAGLGTATATLVGQALGRGDAADAKRWGWQIAGWSAAGLMTIGLFAAIAPRVLLAPFLTDPATLAHALLPIAIVGLTVGADAFVRVLGFGLRGAGATRTAAAIPFAMQWFLELPLVWFAGVALHGGLVAIVTVRLVLTFAEAAAFAFVWQRERWSRIAIGGLHTAAEPPARWERIAVLGGAGAGKSTLARAIGEKLGLPVFHLDRFVYGPNWTHVETSVAHARLAEALSGGRWVVDGTYGEFRDLTLARADLVIWIAQPAPKRLWRTWRKTRIYRDKPRADRPDGCEERFSWGYVRTVLNFGRWTRDVEKRLRTATPGRVICLKGDRAVRKFVDTLAECDSI